MTDPATLNEDEEFPPDVMREASDVARRCCILIAVAGTGHRQPRQPAVDWLMSEGLWEFVTPNERAFLLDDTASQEQIADATWRAEALHVLLWALRWLPAL